ncbi:hypothetical protein [Butyricicoccus pullicaecorum]|uniref:hypothetical protein n=1 Tax=Butyricicoccus pullicaecorum TaxID=501571 RepID=UPI001FA8D571|nr:hypothetical protein [Butyricicoccus pullicaecorum]
MEQFVSSGLFYFLDRTVGKKELYSYVNQNDKNHENHLHSRVCGNRNGPNVFRIPVAVYATVPQN